MSLWNQCLDALPESCDVLVIGAGPAGSACSQLLARAGLHVVVVDAQTFPREKVCGDGLVPDTHAALRRLGVHAQVMAAAHRVVTADCVAPSGRVVEVPGELAVLQRKQLDAILCQAAVDAGVLMVAPARLIKVLRDSSQRCIGASIEQAGKQRNVLARWLVLATGAAISPLLLASVCQRRAPSAMALRTYVRHPGLASGIPGLRFVWHPRLRGGYGWIFPGPEGVFNIGVGVLDSRSRPDEAGAMESSGRNLREMFDDFVALDPMARRLISEGEQLARLKGAPLRCDLDGARWTEPGLLLVGDAVGSTYAFTGEGIGKAMETGMAAAEALISKGFLDRNPTTRGDSDEAVMQDYRARLSVLLPRFQMYRKAASFNRHPWLISLVVWRAQGSARLRQRLSEILGEQRMPGSLLSWRGIKSILRG